VVLTIHNDSVPDVGVIRKFNDPVHRVKTVLTALAIISAAHFVHAQQPPYSWRGINGSGVFPAHGLVTEFHDLAPDMTVEGGGKTLTLPGKPGERKNIVWRTTLPHWGQNAPVVVQDRVFVLCDEGWKSDAPLLVCLDARDGKILWQQPVDHLDAWPADKAKVAKECRAKEVARYSKYMTWWNRLYWDNEKNGWAAKPVASGKMFGPGQPESFTASPAELLEQAKADGLKMPESWRLGVSGGWRSRYGLNEDTGDGKANYEKCVRNRYYWYTGWSSEGPYFQMTMGSVVSDGAFVYAVTGFDAATCFDLAGNRQWVTDLEGRLVVGYPASMPIAVRNHMSSPVLADGKLVYYHRDDASMFGLDAKTGKILWKTECPKLTDTGKDFGYLKGKPVGYEGHMGPGGTPVVMTLGETTVAVSGNGLVVRVSDGKLLGQVKVPQGALVRKNKEIVEAEADTHGSSYNSWVAHDDVLFFNIGAGLYAARLSIAGDALGQELLWRADAEMDGRAPNLVFHDGKLYGAVSKEKRRGVAAIDPATGKVLTWGPTSGGHDTSLAFGKGIAVWPTVHLGDKTEGKSNPATTPGHGMTSYVVVSLPDLKKIGEGHLCPEAPAGEIRDRHIARIGTARTVWGNAGTTAWGNRIFVRNNDYLWCIGDPKTSFQMERP
jgi:outer membrane protein assembly factor BamB